MIAANSSTLPARQLDDRHAFILNLNLVQKFASICAKRGEDIERIALLPQVKQAFPKLDQLQYMKTHLTISRSNGEVPIMEGGDR